MRTVGIDLGTSGVRAVLLDGDRVIEARATPADRRDPSALWDAVLAALSGFQASGVTACAVAGTSGSVLAVGRDGVPLSRILLYGDAGSGTFPDAPALARMRALKDIPGVRKMLHEADWIAGRLCGRYDVTDANNALKSGYDPVAAQWPGWVGAAIRPEWLPDVVGPGTAIGVAPALGGATVVAGTTDGCAAFLSTGADGPGDAVTSLGSTLTLKLLSTGPIKDACSGVYSHALRGLWLAGGASNTGGAVLAHYFTPDRIAALSTGIDASRDSGLDLYPLLAPGERFPLNDPALLPRMDRPADDRRFLHGLLEGIARIEARGYARLAELGAPRVRRVLSVGGGAANASFTAIRARTLGIAVSTVAHANAAHGAAILARGSVVPCHEGQHG